MNYKQVVISGMIVSAACLLNVSNVHANELNSLVGQSVGLDSLLEEVVVIKDKEVEKQIADEQTWGYTNLGIADVEGHLNIRAIPSTDGKLVGKLSGNGACEILSFEGDWAKVSSGKVEGYVSTEFLLMGQRAIDRANEVVSTVATVTTDALKVREEATTDSEVVTTVANGEELDVVDTNTDGWVKITLDSTKVYVSAEFVEVNDKLKTAVTMTELLYGEGVSDVRVDLCNYGKQFVGNPYVWGGTSLTNGADCSGFVQQIYRKYGINLPRTSAVQAREGVAVSASEMKAGDLIFYAQGGTVNHVAIYIGNGQVLHASDPSSGIKISNAFYRQAHTIRRVLP